MSEPFTPRMRKHLEILQRYMRALDTGDLTTLADVLHLAERDSTLERLLLETSLVCQAEDHFAVSQEEEASALAAIGEATGISPRKDHANASGKAQHLLLLQDIPEKERSMDDSNTFTPTLASKTKTSIQPARRTWLQTFVAILVMCALIGGFLVVFNDLHVKTTKAPGQTTVGAQPTRLVGPTIPATNNLLITSYIDLSAREIKVAARRADTGKAVWNSNLSPADPQQLGRDVHMTVQNQVVYATANGQIFALHADTGTLIWQKDLHPGGAFKSLTYDHGMLYLAYQAIPSQVYAVEAQQGNMVWHHTLGTDVVFTASNGIVYLGIDPNGPYDSGSVVALVGANGHQLWSRSIPAAISFLVAGNTFYAFSVPQQTSSDQGGNKQMKTLAAFNATTGHPLWTTGVEDDGPDSLVASANLVILYRTTETQAHLTQFCAYSSTTGQQAWCTTGDQGSRDTSMMAQYQVVGNVLLATYSNESYQQTAEALSLSTGQVLWSRPLDRGNSSMPIPMLSTILNGVLYLANDHDLMALRVSDGALFWQISEQVFLSSIATNG